MYQAKNENISERKQKDNFILLVRALIKHLSETKPKLLRKVEKILKQCSMRHKEGIDPFYESLTKSIQMRLMPIISGRD